MASKKVKKSPSSKKKTSKSSKKTKRVRKASSEQKIVKPIPPVPPLSEKDLQKMEEARSHYDENVNRQAAEKKKKQQERRAKDIKASLSDSANKLFDKHAGFCSRIQKIITDINGLAAEANEIHGSMRSGDLRTYNINRRLNFDSLVKDLRVASTQLSRVSSQSLNMAKVHRDLVIEDINSEKPAFE